MLAKDYIRFSTYLHSHSLSIFFILPFRSFRNIRKNKYHKRFRRNIFKEGNLIFCVFAVIFVLLCEQKKNTYLLLPKERYCFLYFLFVQQRKMFDSPIKKKNKVSSFPAKRIYLFEICVCAVCVFTLIIDPVFFLIKRELAF